MRPGCIISPNLFNVYTTSVIREAYIEKWETRSGNKIGGKLVSNLRYADDTTRYGAR